MNDYQKNQCLELTDRMLKRKICSPFYESVAKFRDLVPQYFEIIKYPMDLTTIKTNLENNVYPTIDDWAKDVELIWSNALKYNGEDTVIAKMAIEMRQWFRRRYETISRSINDIWVFDLIKASKKLEYISRHPLEKFS